jgi:hypothetical protein
VGEHLVAKKKINVAGVGEVDAEQVGFRPVQEFWNEYHLDDGSTLRLKLVVTTVLRVPDMFDAEGNPAYLVNSTNVMAVDAPEDLRKKD